MEKKYRYIFFYFSALVFLQACNAINTIRVTGLDVDIGSDGTDDDVTAE